MAARGIRIDRPIVLVGMMGAGKSTVGPLLARKLSLPFVDSDREVEKSAGLAVAEIFRRHGESRFRELERAVIDRLASGPVRVIAAGGGSLLCERSRSKLLKLCLLVWIDVGVETLAVRIGEAGGRPLLDGKDLRQTLADMVARRAPIYARSPLVVSGDSSDPEAVADAICDALTGWEVRA